MIYSVECEPMKLGILKKKLSIFYDNQPITVLDRDGNVIQIVDVIINLEKKAIVILPDYRENEMKSSICLTPRIVALMYEGFNCAGDGGIDPFTPEQRHEVASALSPCREELRAEQVRLGADAVHQSRKARKAELKERRNRLLQEVANLNEALEGF